MISIRMLKKSVLDFFSHDLTEWDSSKSHKLLDFSNLAIWQSIHGLQRRLLFKQPPLLKRAFYVLPAFLLTSVFAAPSFGASAEENYKFYCAQCHGVFGKGDGPNATREMPVSPRDHTNALEMNKLTDEDVMNAIAEGGPATSKSSLMPPFGKTLSKNDIVELKNYVRKLCNCKGK